MYDIKEIIEGYIKECDQIIESKDASKAKDLQDTIIAALNSEIPTIKKNLYFDWNMVHNGKGNPDNYISNLKKIKDKLLVYLATLNSKKGNTNGINISLDNSSNNSSNNTNNNTNTTNNNLEILFEKAREEVENNESLSEEEINEVLEKIKEIKEISESDETKNKKWFKLRPTMEWLGTKGVSVATAVLGLITAILKMQ